MGRARGVARPLAGAPCSNHTQYLAFAPSISEIAAGFWPFCILLFLTAPTVNVCCYAQSQFLWILLLERRLSRCRPSCNASQAPAYLSPPLSPPPRSPPCSRRYR